MPTVFGYTRVSTREQANKGLSLEAQEKRIEKEFKLRYEDEGYDLGEIFEERAVSGGRRLFNRKQGFRLSQAVKKGDIVIFTRLDRGFRNTLDCLTTAEAWKEMGVSVVLLEPAIDTSTKIGWLMLTVVSAFAEFERSQIAQRIGDVYDTCRRRGYKMGRTPLTLKRTGTKGNVKWDIEPEEYRVGKAIVAWRDSGFSWDEIVKHLNTNNVLRPQAGTRTVAQEALGMRSDRWTSAAVRRYYLATLKTKVMVAEGKLREPVQTTPPG